MGKNLTYFQKITGKKILIFPAFKLIWVVHIRMLEIILNVPDDSPDQIPWAFGRPGQRGLFDVNVLMHGE